MEELFDLSEEYDDMLNQGLKYSGEDKFYFLNGRLKSMLKTLPRDIEVKKILDFGCGIGDTSIELQKLFPEAKVFGVDTAKDAIRTANERYPKINFSLLEELTESNFDLCYCNGVFHHIAPENRIEATKYVFTKLKSGGIFSAFDNNPINPGTRYVMSKIPFDKDAIPLTHYSMKKELRNASFDIIKIRFLFIFPAFLKVFRFLEPLFSSIPLGAQYQVIALKK